MVTLAKLSVGQRVVRQDHTRAYGTVVEIEGGVAKVKWDDGRTSYYRPDATGEVDRLNPADGNSN